MQKIDRLGWAAGMTFSAYGRRVGVRVNDPDVLELLPPHLPFGWKPSTGEVVDQLYSLFRAKPQANARVRPFHLLYGGITQVARSLEMSDIWEALERDSRMYVAEYARNRVFVHAAVVGWNGKAIVIPGKSMSGKTSLAAEFVRAGATYYSDEYAVFDKHGRVHPFAKPLSIRSGQENGYRQTDHPVEAFGGRAGAACLPVGGVLVTNYSEGSRWRPRPISPGVGALALLANTVAARQQPEKTMDVLQKALDTAPIWKGVRGEAAEVVEFVLRGRFRGRRVLQTDHEKSIGSHRTTGLLRKVSRTVQEA